MNDDEENFEYELFKYEWLAQLILLVRKEVERATLIDTEDFYWQIEVSRKGNNIRLLKRHRVERHRLGASFDVPIDSVEGLVLALLKETAPDGNVIRYLIELLNKQVTANYV